MFDKSGQSSLDPARFRSALSPSVSKADSFALGLYRSLYDTVAVLAYAGSCVHGLPDRVQNVSSTLTRPPFTQTADSWHPAKIDQRLPRYRSTSRQSCHSFSVVVLVRIVRGECAVVHCDEG